jgi:hypothetical protein
MVGKSKAQMPVRASCAAISMRTLALETASCQIHIELLLSSAYCQTKRGDRLYAKCFLRKGCPRKTYKNCMNRGVGMKENSYLIRCGEIHCF